MYLGVFGPNVKMIITHSTCSDLNHLIFALNSSNESFLANRKLALFVLIQMHVRCCFRLYL